MAAVLTEQICSKADELNLDLELQVIETKIKCLHLQKAVEQANLMAILLQLQFLLYCFSTDVKGLAAMDSIITRFVCHISWFQY